MCLGMAPSAKFFATYDVNSIRFTRRLQGQSNCFIPKHSVTLTPSTEHTPQLSSMNLPMRIPHDWSILAGTEGTSQASYLSSQARLPHSAAALTT